MSINAIGVNTQQLTLPEIIQHWKDRIVCHPPTGKGIDAYIINSTTGDRVKYIEANCDSLRHNATNYDRLLIEIKTKHTGIHKEAILNTIKYEATRRAFKTQHQWINESYQSLIKEAKNSENNSFHQQNLDRQMIAQINHLNKLIAIRDRELKQLKSECKGELKELQAAYKKLQRQLKQEQKLRIQLGKSNKSLGAYKGQFRQAQKKITLLKEENKNLKSQIKLLEINKKTMINS
jgi:DNA repair exonuclease SbcCD ATPase subunit